MYTGEHGIIDLDSLSLLYKSNKRKYIFTFTNSCVSFVDFRVSAKTLPSSSPEFSVSAPSSTPPLLQTPPLLHQEEFVGEAESKTKPIRETLKSTKETKELEVCLEKFYDIISYYYSIKNISYSNSCDSNIEYICKNIKSLIFPPSCKNYVNLSPSLPIFKIGKIILIDWKPNDNNNLDIIKNIYGPTGNTIGSKHHTLAYYEIIINNIFYRIAIEISLYIPYNLQYYIGTSWENLEEILKKRYQCYNIILSFDIEKPWYKIIEDFF